MKQLFFLLSSLLCVGISHAANISFVDSDLRIKLVSSSTSNTIAKNQNGDAIAVDVNGDNQISESEALAVYELNINGSNNIEDLGGILFFTNLRVLNAQSCSLAHVDLHGMVNLQEVNFKNNQTILTLDVSGCVAITSLNCKGNLLSTLDVSSLVNLVTLDMSNNSNLATLFIKNGTVEAVDVSSCGSLSYICADDDQISTITNQVDASCVVNSYCTLPPGGAYNTIRGLAIFDALGNGIDASDLPQPDVKINCSMGATTLQTITNADGNYIFTTPQTGNYTFVPSVENSSWFNVVAQNGNFPDANNNVRTQDFAITPIGNHHDVEVVVLPINQARPGFQATYEVVYRNKGNQTHAGQVAVTYNSTLLTYVSSNTTLTASVGLLALPYSNLRPFESRKFSFTVNVSGAAAIGDVLSFGATIDTNSEAVATQSDNSFNYNQSVVNTAAINVNRIDCLENNLLPTSEIGDYLHYMINFENTGTTTVNNIVIKTQFNPVQFDINSVQVLDSSLPTTVEIINNSAFFKFRNAGLGGPGGHGGILLKIKSNSGLTAGSTVNAGANIFFEYNDGLPTNTTATTYQNLTVEQHNLDTSIRVYPNPTSDVIQAEGNTIINSIELYDVFGRLLQTNITGTTKATMDVSQRATGTYFLKITTATGQKVEQIEKK